jgi:cytochrome c oxidase subunit 2
VRPTAKAYEIFFSICGRLFRDLCRRVRPDCATPAESVYHLSLLVVTVCAAIFFTVAGLLTFTIVRFRRKADDGREPAQVYGSNRIEIAWTVIPILIVWC